MLVKRRTKKPAVWRDDVMLGLEKGDEARRSVRLLDFAEADEGVHLVNVAADLLRQPLKRWSSGSARSSIAARFVRSFQSKA